MEANSGANYMYFVTLKHSNFCNINSDNFLKILKIYKSEKIRNSKMDDEMTPWDALGVTEDDYNYALKKVKHAEIEAEDLASLVKMVFPENAMHQAMDYLQVLMHSTKNT